MSSSRPWWRSRWWIPAFSLFLGACILVAFWVGGDLREGVIGFGVLAGIGLVSLLGSKSETISGLSGPGRDERWERIDILATAFAGIVLITLVIALWLYEIAHGRSGNPYGLLGAVAGLAYVAGVAWLRFRS
ncbi:MAG TPA: hypothetical protein VH281_00750 [Gaiellaceae bacterium]